MGIRSLAAELLPSALQGLGRIALPQSNAPAVEASSFAALNDKLAYLSKADLKQGARRVQVRRRSAPGPVPRQR